MNINLAPHKIQCFLVSLQCVLRCSAVVSCCLERTTCVPSTPSVPTRTSSTCPTLRPACPSMLPYRTTVTYSTWDRFTHRPLSTSSDITAGPGSSTSLTTRTVSVISGKGMGSFSREFNWKVHIWYITNRVWAKAFHDDVIKWKHFPC